MYKVVIVIVVVVFVVVVVIVVVVIVIPLNFVFSGLFLRASMGLCWGSAGAQM
jgi:hypothetical protein